MRTKEWACLCFLLAAFEGWCSAIAAGGDARMEWRFGAESQWSGWHPGSGIREVKFGASEACFRTTGGDPQILSPVFELAPASNLQWVEIDLDCEAPGEGELFYTNKTTGRYAGLEPAWMTRLTVPAAGRQTVKVWPFWEGLGKIIRLRFDPPNGMKCTLYAIRIMDASRTAPPPAWRFGKEDSWQAMHNARLERGSGRLRVHALGPQAMIITPVEPFDAAERSMLRLKGWCSGEPVIGFYWVTREHPGLMGEPIRPTWGELASGGALDLRKFPTWQGTVTHLAIAFGARGNERLELLELSIEPNDASPVLRARYLGFERPINRPEQPATIKAILEHAGGPAVPAGTASLIEKRGNQSLPIGQDVSHPAIEPGGRLTLTWNLVPVATRTVQLKINGQTFTADVRLDPLRDTSRPQRPLNDYVVPPPRPVKTDYNIGVYYFPGWSADQMSRWERQRDFPEREPVLGWYAEGEPEVADWHIKWAVENGLSFFIYDWYWRDGREQLGAALNQGFLKARYNALMKFAVMWANHKPYSSHTPEQLLEVTDYWLEHYFRRPNYLTIDGKPYVSFFSPGELISNLGSPRATRAALDAMRERAKAAGLSGLHIAACGGTDRPSLEALKEAGFDSVTGYNYLRTGAAAIHSLYRQFLLGHEDIWQRIHNADVLPCIPLLTVGWDARPWHGPRTERKFARQTVCFAEGLRRLKAHLDATGGKTAILEAWNEWGEGSYIEPNAEFGFGDLEAIRDVFAAGGDRPANIGPADVGLEGRYDLRLRSTSRPATQPAATAPAEVLPLVQVHPHVWEGLAITCHGTRIEVADGQFAGPAGPEPVRGGRFESPPAELVLVKDLSCKLVDGPVQEWRGGNRLVIRPDDRRNLLPGSYVPGSLSLRDPADPAKTFVAGRDYVVDDTWGAFALVAGGSLKAGQEVLATYWMSQRRVDSLVIEEGRVRLIRGVPSPDCPMVPDVPPDTAKRLANVYRPFNATNLKREHIYPLLFHRPRPESPVAAAALQPVRDKLRKGQPVTIVCWGDSVTACGEASTPQRCYVGVLETMLRDRYGRKVPVKVINAGIGGSNTLGRLPNFQKEVLDYKPDVVTLEFVNDMGIPVERLRQLYAEILRQTRAAGAVLVLTTPHFVMPSWMSFPGQSRSEDPRPGVAFLREFARENNVPLADVAARWEQLQEQGIPYEVLLRNGINHPDDRGHAIAGLELAELFR